jgi:hypothetical protein
MSQHERQPIDQILREALSDLGGDVVGQRPIPPTLEEPRGINATPQLTHAGPESATPRPVASRPRGSSPPEHPAWGGAFNEGASLIDAPAFYGPPVSFLLGPWLLLVLLLIGPVALIFTILVVMAVAAVVLALAAAVIASPYLLIRHLHGRGTAHVDNPLGRCRKRT